VSDPFTPAAAHGRSPGGCRNPDCHTPSPGRLTLGLCNSCYPRWWRAGFPESGVPAPFIHVIVPCWNPDCRGPSPSGHRTRGLCDACYSRWSNAGFPDSGVPGPRKGGWPRGKPRGPAAALAARQEDYAFLRSPDGGHLSPQDAAERIGVSLDTVMAPGGGYEPCEPALVNEAALCAPAESCSLSQD
jgi:hypothetical protein